MRPVSLQPVWEAASRTRVGIGRQFPRGSALSWKARCFGQKFGLEHSSENFSHHSCRLYAGQFLFQSLKSIVQLVMIEAEQIEHGRVQVANLNRILDDFVPHIVGLSIADAGFHSTAGHPDGEGAWI